MERETAVQWIYKALEMKIGESLFIPCDNKQSLRDKLKTFRKELDILSEISYQDFSTLELKAKFQDGKFWIVLNRVAGESVVAFKKCLQDRVEKVKL